MTGAPLTAAQAPHFDWANTEYVRKVVLALETAAPGGNRFVGGCVRDSLLGLPPKDIDLATVLTPQDAARALDAAGLGCAPTGVEHGTVTAIADHSPVEVTTLRADVSTDGRRAVVAFTDDWRVDARRRDFTINAIYFAPDGLLFDYLGGLGDLADRRVRFIGDPDARIREDYLRILRFFRFSARFSEGRFDAEGLDACRRLADGVRRLSSERVGQELGQLLSLASPGAALTAMAGAGVLGAVWPAPPDLAAAQRIKRRAPDAPAPLMLAALWGEAGDGLGAALRLSNIAEKRRAQAVAAAGALYAPLTRESIRIAIFDYGRDAFFDGVLLAYARGGLSDADTGLAQRVAETEPPPAFPIKGRDVLALGAAPGPAVSAALQETRRRWREEDFPGDPRLRAILVEEVVRQCGGDIAG